MKDCIIFGASVWGKRVFELLCRDYHVVAFSDNDSSKWGKLFCGCPIIPPRNLIGLEETDIMLASSYYMDISRQLKEMNITNIKIPYFCNNFYYYDNNQSNINGNKNYEIYDAPKYKLFSHCNLDEEMWKKIEENFSLNYSFNCDKNDKRIDIPNTDRRLLLFCAYYFPPDGGAGVQRSLKFVKYLRKFGYEPIVLTLGQKKFEAYGWDKTLLSEIEDDIQIIRIDSKLTYFELLSEETQQQIYNLLGGILQSEKWMKYLKEMVEIEKVPDLQIEWANECLKKIENRIDLKKIDLIFTTGCPFSSFIIGYYIKKKYGIKWVQDYRDPWTTDDYYNSFRYKLKTEAVTFLQQIEKKLITYSDAVTVVMEDMINGFEKSFQITPEKFLEITNGYDETDFHVINDKSIKNSKFTLCHNGAVYKGRSTLPLLRRINHLIDSGKINSEGIQWILIGRIDDESKKEIARTDQYHIVKCIGYHSHQESVHIAMRADLLILLGSDGGESKNENGCTGKVFEYLRMYRPILAFASHNGYLERMLRKTDSGSVFEFADQTEIEMFLYNEYKNWENEGNHPVGIRETISSYSRENLTGKLANLFNQLLL